MGENCLACYSLLSLLFRLLIKGVMLNSLEGKKPLKRYYLNSLNCTKTNFFVCTAKRKSKSVDSFKITIGNHDIQSVAKVKYLGVTFDKQLSWIAHIDNIIKKLSCATRIFSTIRRYTNKQTLINLYYSFACPHL